MPSADWLIGFDPLAEKDIKKLWHSDRKIAQRIVRCIECLKLDPFEGKPLTGTKKGIYSLRMGDWRVLYELYPARKIVHVVRIGHRRDIYR